MERTTFQGNDLPWQLYGPGNTLIQTLTFNADGTIATATDAKSRTTTVGNWYRGIPRSVQFADGTGMSATVTALGWVDSVTDPNGFVRSFGYNAMGRVSQITHPTGDAVAWAPTTIAFTKVAATEYGIGAGHWRETVITGNARKETYFDALWRPLVVREYDALGRPTSVGQDADGVVLVSAVNYDSYGGAIGKVIDGIGYTGHVMDLATGLTYMQQRYYDPAVGRFLSVDPVTASSVNGGNFNRYWYANNTEQLYGP